MQERDNSRSTHSEVQRFPQLLYSLRNVLAIFTILVLSFGPAGSVINVLNNPPVAPISILAFPQRDFVSASGYDINDKVIVRVIHSNLYGGGTLSTDPAKSIVPQDDPTTPGFDGIVEVNHPGGECWFGTTPDIRPGDRVQIEIVENNAIPGRVGQADETTVANVTVRRPLQNGINTVEIHGTAEVFNANLFPNPNPTPLDVAALEQRLVAPGELFDLNNRRTLRATNAAGANGTLSYDAPGSINWTATYTLSPADVTRALGAESRIMWLGNNPGAAVEATIYELGAAIIPGPQAPCAAPLEVLPPPPGSELIPPSQPTGMTAVTSNSNTVTMNWTDSTDNIGVTSYGVYRDGIAIANVQNFDGSAPAPTTYIDKNVPPGTYTYTVDAADAVGNRSPQSAGANATTTALTPPQVTANEPPIGGRSILVFPSRDFISADGYGLDEKVTVEVLRNGNIVSTASALLPQGDTGLVEVNHPGGYCWEGVTPELRAGDIVRTTAYAPDDTIRSIDQVTVANVTAHTAVVIQPASPGNADGIVAVHGMAQDVNGNPIDIAQLEQRLVGASRDPFDLNHRRTIRAPGDGAIEYDTVNNPTGTSWTATYTGLTAHDVALATSIESRILWLGRDPLAGVEDTLYETGTLTVPGPAAGFCSTALEPADLTPPAAPTGLTATQNGANVDLNWTLSPGDDWYVYGYQISKDSLPIGYVNATTTQFSDIHVTPGTHTYAVQAFDTASPHGLGATILDQLIAGQGGRYGNLSLPAPPPQGGGNTGDTVSFTTTDVTAPTTPGNLTAIASGSDVIFAWSPSADAVGVTSYKIFKSGSGVPGSSITFMVNPATNCLAQCSYTVLNLNANTYTFQVTALDAAGNESAPATATVTITQVTDITPPSVPGNVQAVVPDIHGKTVNINWTASTDDIGVAAYMLRRNNTIIATINAVPVPANLTYSFTDVLLVAGTYGYTVEASDSAGNLSGESAPAARAIIANDPPPLPHSLIAFPARDFISATGYTPNQSYTFQLIRGNRVFTSAPFPADAAGLIEVNHPGGTCWLVNTPDMRAGDVIRIIDTTTGVADQTTVANVTTGRPIATNANTVVIHGTAQDTAGAPLPVDQIQHRFIAGTANAFDLNGRRTLTAGAGGEGTISYDTLNNPTGTKWTATYTGLSADDMQRVMSAESRGIWLGRSPLVGNELTIFENGTAVAGGPSAPCTAPAETPVPAATIDLPGLSFGNLRALPLPATTSASMAVTFSNGGGAPMTITEIYRGGVNPGDFSISLNTCPAILAPLTSCSVIIRFTPTAVGLRQATLNFSDNAANTTDQSVTLTGTGIDTTAPGNPGTPAHSLVQDAQLGVNGGSIAASTIPVKITWTASIGGGPLSHYQLQQSLNGAPFADTTAQPGTAAEATLNLTMGTTTTPNSYRYQVRACNNGNCTAWFTGPTFGTMPIDESNSGFVSFGGTWTTQTLANTYGGTQRFASTNKDKAQLPNKTQFTVNGSIGWVAVKGPDRGRATVSVDGGAPVTVDLYAPSERLAVLPFVINNLASGRQHNVTVQVLGTRNAASKGNRVDLDGFVLLK